MPDEATVVDVGGASVSRSGNDASSASKGPVLAGGGVHADRGGVQRQPLPSPASVDHADEVAKGFSSDSDSSEFPFHGTATTPLALTEGIVFQGFLEKFSIGRSLLGRSNWKRRFFVFGCYDTIARLEYYKNTRGGRPVGVPCGGLQLDRHSTRIVTRPSTLTHEKAGAIGRDICIIFYERDTGKEYRILLRTESSDGHKAWSEALACVFTKVNVPSDYGC